MYRHKTISEAWLYTGHHFRPSLPDLWLKRQLAATFLYPHVGWWAAENSQRWAAQHTDGHAKIPPAYLSVRGRLLGRHRPPRRSTWYDFGMDKRWLVHVCDCGNNAHYWRENDSMLDTVVNIAVQLSITPESHFREDRQRTRSNKSLLTAL